MESKYGSSLQVSATSITVIAHFMGIAAITLLLAWIMHFRGGLSLNSGKTEPHFNLHPFLMLLGMVFLGGEAIMAYKTFPGSKKAQKFAHMVLHFLALPLSILGLYAVFKYHKDLSLADMYSLHSWLGMGTLCLFAFQWLIGFLSFWYPGAAKSTRANLVPWHALLGIVIFFLAICTAEMGLVEIAGFLNFVHGSQALLLNFTGLAIILFGIAVGFSVILPRA